MFYDVAFEIAFRLPDNFLFGFDYFLTHSLEKHA